MGGPQGGIPLCHPLNCFLDRCHDKPFPAKGRPLPGNCVFVGGSWLHSAAVGTSQRPICSRGPFALFFLTKNNCVRLHSAAVGTSQGQRTPDKTHTPKCKKYRKQGGLVGFRLPTHRVAAARALTFCCWHHRPHCAGAQSNQLSILRPDRQKGKTLVNFSLVWTFSGAARCTFGETVVGMLWMRDLHQSQFARGVLNIVQRQVRAF